ncbi:MAG: cation-translocating P-type ATPase [Vulcanimicrobiota bacterium]
MPPKLPEHPHSLAVEDLIGQLEVTAEHGLSAAEVDRRLDHFGPNRFAEESKISPFSILLGQFKDTMVLILLAATVVAFGAWYTEGAHGVPYDALIILAIVVANALLGFTQEYQAERTLEALQQATEVKTRVLREGAQQAVTHEQLVPGDILYLSEGDRIPADGVLLKASHFQSDESPLTGESLPVSKRVGLVEPDTPVADRTNSVFAGSVVTAGEATAVVVSTGKETQLGRIAERLSTTEAVKTPLQNRLDGLGKQIGWGVAVLTVIIGATVLLVEGKTDTDTLLRVAMFSVALAVAAVPEGLPAVLTVSLSAGARRLAQRNAVARKMAAVETLGSVTVIMTDKTGTLTHNQMTVKSIALAAGVLGVSGDGYGREGVIDEVGPAVVQLARCGLLASGSELAEENGQRTAVGDPMDAALLVLAEKAGLDWRAERQQREKVDEAPFSSDRAMVSYLWRQGEELTLHCKGSLEKILSLATHFDHGEGPQPLDEDLIKKLRDSESEFGRRAWRTLAIAYRKVAAVAEVHELENELVLVGLAAFADPPRETVAPAIERCRAAGIRVVMLTGDHPATATAIAHEVGIGEGQPAISGRELAAMSDSEFEESVKTHDIFARVTPDQKLHLAECLLRQGEVVAMTGDGVNDAPALKKVHVGVAMGRSGTAVAVEASDLVLMQDDFSTIVEAVAEGRSIYANVQRFIAFLFSGNFGVVVAMFVGTLIAGLMGLRYDGELLLPLTAAQILWMNLVTDGAPAVAFALGAGDESFMKSPPRDPRSPILTRRLFMMIAVTGTTLAAFFLLVLDLLYVDGLFTAPTHLHDHVYARTAAFYTLVTARLVNALNFLHLDFGVTSAVSWNNKAVPAACLFSWLLTVGLLFFAPAAKAFNLATIDPATLAVLTMVAVPLVLIPAEIFKRLR